MLPGAPLPHMLCSHLQNVTRKRIQLTSIPYTAMNLGICGVMLRQGLISNLTRGHPLKKSTDPLNPLGFDNTPKTHQALHITLKYRNGLPVLARAHIVSRPSVHLYVDSSELKAMLTGGRIKHRQGMGMGEIAVVRTKDGRYLEGWEAYAEGVGGEVICKLGGY
ncbi:ribosomal protein S8 [Mrakia frigida]|uniref:mitochondrial 37S ribosomal protein uS8m MRPS8 n=1 Tax=Mrakia frigida TaxID=29902 RepID=UPI003FCC1A50